MFRKRLLSKSSKSEFWAEDTERRSGAYSDVREHLSTGSTNPKTDYEELRKKSGVCICGGMSQSIEKSFFHDFSSEFDDFARDIAKNRYTVLCGGVTVGLIGEAIRLVKKYGGKVNGAVIDCEKEDIHAALDSVAYFNSYAERQAYMFSEVNKIVFLPGGLGTLHELCDLLIKAKMDFFQKNVFFFDFCDFWRPFFDLLNRAVDIGFIEAKDVGYTVINRQLGFSSVFEG